MSSTTSSFSLEDVVMFVVQRASHETGITRLMKLMYLADVEHIRTFGQRFGEIDWIWHDFGPFSPQIYDAVEALDAQGAVRDILMVDHRAVDRMDAPATPPRRTPAPRQRYTLHRVLSRYGDCPLEEISDAVYQDRIVLDTDFHTTPDSVSSRPLLADSTPALASLLKRAGKPDTRSWGDPDASASEDAGILEELSGLRREANRT